MVKITVDVKKIEELYMQEMNINELKIEEEFLTADLEEACTLASWKNYCLAQMNYCVETQDKKGTRHWILEHKRTVNDLEFLQFKKIDSERKIKNEQDSKN